MGILSWFGKAKDTIRVEFVKHGTEAPFAVSDVPVAQLPETFEIDTTLDLQGQRWGVVEALPPTKREFARTGKLRVTLSEFQSVSLPPGDILFSLPTINDRMCELVDTASVDGLLLIHEDDWRQIEFITTALRSEVEREIAAIRLICESKRQGGGFAKLHVRRAIEQPFVGRVMNYDQWRESLRITKEYRGFGLRQCISIACNGFAFETANGLVFFGQKDEAGNVVFLCLLAGENLAENCGPIVATHDLLCVDWCRGTVIGG